MKCKNCNTEVNVSTKFCPNCGKQVFDVTSNIKFTDISIAWIEETVNLLGYTVNHENCGENEFRAVKEKALSVFISLKKDLKMITCMIYLSIKKVKNSDKITLLEILNVANSKGSYCTFFINFDKEYLAIYSYMIITDGMSKQDFLHLMERFNDEMINTINITKLVDYIQ